MTSRHDPRDMLSTLWVFVLVNCIFCDLLSLSYGPIVNTLITGTAGEIGTTPGDLLTVAVIMEVPMAMIVLAKYLPFKASKATNMAAALFMAAQQAATLALDTLILHHVFFSTIEITASLAIFSLAVQWKSEERHNERDLKLNESAA